MFVCLFVSCVVCVVCLCCLFVSLIVCSFARLCCAVRAACVVLFVLLRFVLFFHQGPIVKDVELVSFVRSFVNLASELHTFPERACCLLDCLFVCWLVR